MWWYWDTSGISSILKLSFYNNIPEKFCIASCEFLMVSLGPKKKNDAWLVEKHKMSMLKRGMFVITVQHLMTAHLE